MKNLARAAVLASVVLLSACSTASNAILQTLPHAYGKNAGVANARLNPDFRYLRVTIDGRLVLLVLGNVESDPAGPIEVWYSAEREVLRLQNGRLVGAVGLTTEWRNVVLPELPTWSALARAQQPYRWTRIRDVMPGYRLGVKDELSVRAVQAPQRSALQVLDPRQLTWFEERDEAEPVAWLSGLWGRNDKTDAALPPARYAVAFSGGRETVIYGEQCLAANLCFSWQRWPVQAQSAAGSK